MGFLDILTGRRKVAGPAPDRLFALSTAYVTLQTEQQIVSKGAAGIVFQPLATADFSAICSDMEEVVGATGSEAGTKVEKADDEFGYRWMILRDPDVEDLVVGVNAVSEALVAGGFGERVLAAVFPFEDAQNRPVYLIYNYKRGAWYPFAPAPGDKQRAMERELQLKAQIGAELPIEPEIERWFPLWGAPI
jgi:PspA associated protein B